MPFVNMPAQFRVRELQGARGALAFDNADLFVRFRPDYDDCSDDHNEPKKVIVTELQLYRKRQHEVYIDGAFSRGGSVEIGRRYWKIKNVGYDPISGAPGDKPLQRVYILFDGKEFTRDLQERRKDPQVQALYEAFSAQHVIQLRLRLAANDQDETIDATTLFLKLEYVPS